MEIARTEHRQAFMSILASCSVIDLGNKKSVDFFMVAHTLR
jgi:hypothetical protein